MTQQEAIELLKMQSGMRKSSKFKRAIDIALHIISKSYNKEDMKLAFETGRNFQLTGENNFVELIEQFKKQ